MSESTEYSVEDSDATASEETLSQDHRTTVRSEAAQRSPTSSSGCQLQFHGFSSRPRAHSARSAARPKTQELDSLLLEPAHEQVSSDQDCQNLASCRPGPSSVPVLALRVPAPSLSKCAFACSLCRAGCGVRKCFGNLNLNRERGVSNTRHEGSLTGFLSAVLTC